MIDIEELRRAVCVVAVVGQVDGHDVVRRESVLNVVDRRRQAARAERAEPASPAAKWRVEGELDPHGSRYDCERAALAMGHLTDDELANGAFINYDARPTLEQLIEGKAPSPIAWMTAVKDRIRWLSRALVRAEAELRVPQGWARVPVEPTPAMDPFICNCDERMPERLRQGPTAECYRAMLAAAPKTEEAPTAAVEPQGERQ